MTIDVTPDLRIVKDDASWAIQRRHVGKDEKNKNFGEERWVSVNWFINLRQAATKVLDMEIGDSTAATFAGLLDTITQAQDNIIAAVEKVK
jgi:hypothetical protein